MKKKSDGSNPPANSSSLDKTESSDRIASAIELGRKLVQELEPTRDTLASWMAHYIADLITVAENAKDTEKEKLLSECCATILKLWEHRNFYPCNVRPLSSFEPIFRQLENLDPAHENHRYILRSRFDSLREAGVTGNLLKCTEDCDAAARAVVRYCFAQAAEKALEKEAGWIQLAKNTASIEQLEMESYDQMSGLGSYLTSENISQMSTFERNSLIEKLQLLSQQTGALIEILNSYPQSEEQGVDSSLLDS